MKTLNIWANYAIRGEEFSNRTQRPETAKEEQRDVLLKLSFSSQKIHLAIILNARERKKKHICVLRKRKKIAFLAES